MTLNTVYSGNEARGFRRSKSDPDEAGPRASGDRSMTEYDPDADSGDGVECPTCGVSFGGENGMKVHHVRAHGESIAGVEVSCSWCNEPKRVDKCHAEKHDRFFCDGSCHGKWRSENRSGEDNPNWIDVTVECATCGSTLDRWPSRNEGNDNNFCSRECYGDWMSKNVTGEDHPLWDGGGVSVECDNCGEEKQATNHEWETQAHFFCDPECQGEWFAENRSGKNSWGWEGGEVAVECTNCGAPKKARRHRYETQDHFFCDPTCQGEWLSENVTGEDHPLWKGGKLHYYGPNWQTQRRKSLNRDEYECQFCGMSDDEHHELHNEELHVHHIKRIKAFNGDYEAANRLDNLITLCQDCHTVMERQNEVTQRFLLQN